MSELEKYFSQFRKDIVGVDVHFESPYGDQHMVYADWIASGRLFSRIEDKMINQIGPLVGNTHSETSETGITMTRAYHLAHNIIKQHVNASDCDMIITRSCGMTGVIVRLQRILGLIVPEQAQKYCDFANLRNSYCKKIKEEDRPVVFVTHVEHHSNHTSWLETIAEVIVIPPAKDLTVDVNQLQTLLELYKDRKVKIGSFSAASNVTGYMPPYREMARMMHKYNGICFVDFAASAPYMNIDMHPKDDPEGYLDAIFFSPHKFLGGPGSSGVLVFNKKLYQIDKPSQPGGGTVKWTDRWNKYSYITDIEVREDGGTPAFLQSIRAAMAIQLKEKMGVENIHGREKELLDIAFKEMKKIPKLHILADNIKDRLGVLSFYMEGIHHNLIVRLLNDRFGIQMRGGCSCAGTYGHYLLHVDWMHSKEITDMIEQGDLSMKPGWVRLSLHPTMTDDELKYITNALNQIANNYQDWQNDYIYSNKTNEYNHKTFKGRSEEDLKPWFEFE